MLHSNFTHDLTICHLKANPISLSPFTSLPPPPPSPSTPQPPSSPPPPPPAPSIPPPKTPGPPPTPSPTMQNDGPPFANSIHSLHQIDNTPHPSSYECSPPHNAPFRGTCTQNRYCWCPDSFLVFVETVGRHRSTNTVAIGSSDGIRGLGHRPI